MATSKPRRDTHPPLARLQLHLLAHVCHKTLPETCVCVPELDIRDPLHTLP